jgi:hypothetical protein
MATTDGNQWTTHQERHIPIFGHGQMAAENWLSRDGD